MGSSRLHQRRRAEIKSRVTAPRHAYPRCVVVDCAEPTMGHLKSGLNGNYCRRHVEHFRRHGSYSKPSYTAAELNPARKAIQAWLEAHQTLPEAQEAVDRVQTRYWLAGRPEEAFRLAGKPPSARAKYVWGRLDQRKISPYAVLAVWLAVALRHASDPQQERRIEFRLVQAGKVLHRMAGGSHKRWERTDSSGVPEVTELHKYPASRGRVLRHLGATLARAAGPLEAHLEAIRAAAGARPSSGRLRLRRLPKAT